MDPALHELQEGDPEQEVEAVVHLGENREPPPGVRLVARFGDIATVRLNRGQLAETRDHEAVVSLKAARPFGLDPEPGESPDEPAAAEASPESLRAQRTDRRRGRDLKPTGRGVAVAVLDWGFDFAHPNFRNRDGSTRALAIWDQSAEGAGPEPYGYGRVYTREQINRALDAEDPYEALGYHPASGDPRGRGAHGTHVADIAAGNGAAENAPAGMAPEADILFVHLATRGTGGRANLGDSATLLEALDWVDRMAGDQPLAINMSVGRHGGPHTGNTLVERGIDAMLSAKPGRALAQSAGNYFSARAHASGQLRPGQQRRLRWRVDRADTTPNELEIWYPGDDLFHVELVAADGDETFSAALGHRGEILADGREVGRIYHRAHDPADGDNHVNIFLYPEAPAGVWELRLRAEDVVDGRYHVWVERDSGRPNSQSRLDADDVDPYGTTGTICNGLRGIAVGAYDAHDAERPMTRFSSAGPTRDGRVKPDIAAPGARILAARSSSRRLGRATPPLTRQSGTSMASPHVAGTLALMFEAAPRPLTIRETRNLLLGAAAETPETIPRDRAGSGFLDSAAAVDAVRRMFAGEDRDSQDAQPERTPSAEKEQAEMTRCSCTETIAPGQEAAPTAGDAPPAAAIPEEERAWPEIDYDGAESEEESAPWSVEDSYDSAEAPEPQADSQAAPAAEIPEEERGWPEIDYDDEDDDAGVLWSVKDEYQDDDSVERPPAESAEVHVGQVVAGDWVNDLENRAAESLDPIEALRALGVEESLRALAGGAAPGPAVLFDIAVGRYGRAMQRKLGERFELIGAPGEAPSDAIHRGDLLIRRALGEGEVGHLAVIAETSAYARRREPRRYSRRARATEPRRRRRRPRRYGRRARVIEPRHRRRRAQTAVRRTLDEWGRVPVDQILLRAKPAGEAAENTPNRNSRAYIRWVQTALNHTLGAGLAVDGIRGPLTRAAIRHFQARRGIGVDGIVGPITERNLIEFGATYPPGGGPWLVPGPPPAFPPAVAIHPNIGLTAQYALRRMSRGDASARLDASESLQAVQAAQIIALIADDDPRAALMAARHGRAPATLIRPGQDAVLLLDPHNLTGGVPAMIFRAAIRYLPERLDPALRQVAATYREWRAGRLNQCRLPGDGEQVVQPSQRFNTEPPLCEQDVPPPRPVEPCGDGNFILRSLLDALDETDRLAGVTFTRANPLCDATALCPTPYRTLHPNLAVHLVQLGLRGIRIAEIAGLFGIDLTSITGVVAKASRSVKQFGSVPPFTGFSFVAIRSGNQREIHIHDHVDRVVESRVNDVIWKSLAVEAQPGTLYTVFKKNYQEASLHRQWGRQNAIEWITGLLNFYQDRTGVRLGVGDISHIVGEHITDHNSHREGRDVDLYPLSYPAGAAYPETYWCDGEGDDMTISALTPPSGTPERYGAPLVTLNQTRQDAVFTLFATVLAYCYASWDRLDAFVWHGARQIEDEALTIAQAAFDAGWQDDWGPAPASRADLDRGSATRRPRLVGQGHGSYGGGWPPHRDHIHIRLNP